MNTMNIIDREDIGRLCMLAGKAERMVITAHIRPDGDAMGSCTALMRFLGTTNSIEHWNEMYNLAVMRIAAKRGVPMLDVRSAFLSARDFTGLFSRDGIHPSPAGHRRMFEYSLPQLRAALG